MSYNPNPTHIDFEIGAFGGKLKKGFKKLSKGVGKVADITIAKPTALIGGMVGGKKGRRFGEKLGKGLAKATTVGTVAGIGGAAAPALAGAAPAIATGLVGKKLLGKKHHRPSSEPSTKPGHRARPHHAKRRAKHHKAKTHHNSKLAAEVVAMLVAKLGGPIEKANRALKLAELQREATFEHRKLMSDAEFRNIVLSNLVSLAKAGNQSCERTVRVLVGRS